MATRKALQIAVWVKQTEYTIEADAVTNRFHKEHFVVCREGRMRRKHLWFSSLLLLLLIHLNSIEAQPNFTGYACSASESAYPCQTYVFYRARAPDFLDLASIADLFGVSRLMIAKPSNISSPASPLLPDQALFVPITCSCNSNNNLSYSGLNYTIKTGNTFYLVSANHFQNLTTYQSVQVVNPTLIPTKLEPGDNVVFPIFCKCPNRTQLQNNFKYLITYVFQPSDNLSSIAARFGLNRQSLVDSNGERINPLDTMFLPVTRIPSLTQPFVPSPVPFRKVERKGVVIGLAVGLAISGFLLILLILIAWLWVYPEFLKLKVEMREDKEKQLQKKFKRVETPKEAESFLADVSGCLDKYRVFGIQEVIEATDDFNLNCVIQGSVYRGYIDGEYYAIKKMKWNACEELKILQKVNHGNLVKLEGFCVDPEGGNCYLVYEYVENGSLHSWLHGNTRTKKLDWKTRLRIAVDVANGLQYVHEHTRPRVVHKDIKTSNILLDGSMRAKIANFGLAKTGCNAITMHIVGTQGYIAPEYLADGVVSTKMDIFAFGVVLLELVSGKEAINDEGEVLWMNADRVMEGEEGEKILKLRNWMDEDLVKESCSVESVMNVMSIAIACLQREPSKRPSMVDIVYTLCKSEDLSLEFSGDGLSVTSVSLTAR